MNARTLLVVATVAVGCSRGSPVPRASVDTLSGALPLLQQRLLEAANIALPPGMPADSLPEAGSAGARILAQFCTQCHALPSPSMHGAADWPGVTRRMWVRIDMMAGGLGVRIPSTAERAQLLTYLQHHALPVAERLPDGVGRELFASACARCHVLVDPRMHSPPDWPVVVMRMRVNMAKMRMAQVSNAEAAQILSYLQAVSGRPGSR